MKNVAKKVLVYVLSAVLIVLSAFAIYGIYQHYVDEKLKQELQNSLLQELDDNQGTYDETRIVLNNTNKVVAESLAERFNAKLRISHDGKYAVLTLPEDVNIYDVVSESSNKDVLQHFSVDYQARVAEVDETVKPHDPESPKYTVTDSLYDQQTYLDYLNMKDTWSKYKGDGITVAVIDSGIDTDHPEFAGRISEYSYNATEDKIVKDYTLEDGEYDWSLIEDEQGHGTAVAGTIAASMDGQGTVGIAPNVNIIVIKVECNESGAFLRTSDLVFGLYYAIERDADVVNMSFGGYAQINPYAEATRLAVDSDVICVAAAGNDGTPMLSYPASDPNVIGVGALADGSWELAEYSNFGDNSDIVAPGTVYTSAMGGGYETINGTSFSSPIVAGAVALLKQQDRYIEFEKVKELLYASSYDLGSLGEDYYFGFGALDMSALLLEERGTITFDMLTNELDDIEKVFIRNHTLQDLPEPERNYAVFDGWYYDIRLTDELNWYSDVFTTDITLYANWVNEDDGIPYTYVILEDGTVEIRSYTGKRRYITIPEKIEGRIVSSIGDNCFNGNSRIREVNLPSGLKTIGLNAFANCPNLIKMAIPDGVENLLGGTFKNDARLGEITFGNNSKLTNVGNFAFQNCGLRSFNAPKNVSHLNGSAFYGCTRLQNITVNKENVNFKSVGGVLYNNTESIIVAYPAGRMDKTYTISQVAKTVGQYAFAFAKLESVEMFDVVTIEASAFAYSYLTSMTMPNSVMAVGEAAFYSNYYLEKLVISANVSVIDKKTFSCCYDLNSVVIPKNINEIAREAFYWCTALKSVTFEEDSKLTIIDENAFYGNAIKEIVFPKSLVSIGAGAFGKNYYLSNVTFEEGSALQVIGGGTNSEGNALGAFYYTTSLQTVLLPSNLTEIGAFAFENSGLTTVTLPSSLQKLGVGAFASCYSLENIYVEEGNNAYTDVNGVVYTADIKTIVAYPAGNVATKYTTLDSVEKIEDCAFYGSNNLQSITMQTGVNTIGEYAFSRCKNVTSYSLPESLTYIERGAFEYNESLCRITIPDNVVQISNYAFSYCYNLATINISDNSKLPRISYASFAYTGITSFRIPKNVSTISQYAFEGSTSLTSVTFAAGSKLDYVPAYMFVGAESLKYITFEQGSALTAISAHGFEGMSNLISVDFGDAKLTRIDNYAFRYCESLTTIVIPEGVTEIGRFAFYGAKSLIELTIPTSVESIGRFAFYHAENLSVYFKAETLPLYLQENWDNGIAGYYVGVSKVAQNESWKYALLASGGISIIEYLGSDTQIDLTQVNLGGDIVQIGGNAFEGSAVTLVILPETLEQIQRYAFANSKLQSIVIPENVRFIGQNAFLYTPIESIEFSGESNLQLVEYYAFAYTYNLKEITLPASVQEVQSFAFYNSAIEQITFEDGISITEIFESTFAGSGLTSIVIPDTVNYIDDNAFRDCVKLKSVQLSGADNLQIHANAFYNTGISTLVIPENVEYIGEYAFIGLENLTEYVVDENNPYYETIDGVLYTENLSKIIAFPAGREGSFVVPNYVETVGFGAFENSSLTHVSFAEDINLLNIGYRAFYNADNLQQISIPASVVSIDYYAFAECRLLNTVIFAENNKLTGVYEGAFLNCISLQNIQLPDTIIEISDFAFYGCSSLTRLPISKASQLKGIFSYAFAYTGIRELTIPDTVVDVDDYAFRGARLEKVVFTDAQQQDLRIGIGAFQDCNNLKEITLPFIGAYFEAVDLGFIGYIFGAGSGVANATYVPASLKTITILEGTTLVGPYAFAYLPDSISLNLPYSATMCVEKAFTESAVKYEWKNMFVPYMIDIYGNIIELTVLNKDVVGKGIIGKLSIDSCVTSIGNLAFYNCSSLTSIEIPESVTSIDNWAFYGCSSLTCVELPNGITSIGDSAFSGCSSLTNIEIPEGVTRIADSAFSGCSSLTNIEIPEGVTSIGSGAFHSCTGLTSIVLPNSIVNIEGNAFNNCSSLFEIHNNSALTLEIGSSNFGGITKYAKLIIDRKGDKTYKDEATGFCMINTSDKFLFVKESGNYELISYCGEKSDITLPVDIEGNNYTLTSIRNVFVVTITITDGVTNIKDNAFSDCINLKTINIGTSVNSVSKKAFSGLNEFSLVISDDNLNMSLKDGVIYDKERTIILSVLPYAKNIIIPNTITSLKGLDASNITSVDFETGASITNIEVSTFSGCHYLTRVKIPNGVISIDENAFVYCSSLTSVELPNSLESIGRNAFYGCNNLKKLEFGDNVRIIGSSIFSGCNNLRLTISERNPYFAEIEGVIYNREITQIIYILPTAKQLTIPRTVNNLSGIQGNNTITSIMFEEGGALTVIPFAAFRDCSSLTSIEIPESVTSIDRYAFSDCSSLTSIEIPDSVTSIGNNAFEGCSSLNNIRIGAGLEIIGNSVFPWHDRYYDKLDNVQLIVSADNPYIIQKDGIVSMGELLLFVDPATNNIIIPKAVTNLSNIFVKNHNIKTVVFEEGSAITSIEASEFSNCISLESIKLPDSVTSIGNLAFYNCSSLTSIKIPESVTSIGDNAFYNCTSLANIEIPDSVTRIADSTFSGCSSLANIEIPEGVTSIGSSAFYGCSSLTSIAMPDSVTSIGDSAFSGCSSLTSVEIPESVMSIDRYAFSGCSSLTNIEIPEGVTSIGYGAFYLCSQLTNLSIGSSVMIIEDNAFAECKSLYQVINNSELVLNIGSLEHGNVAQYAKLIIDKNGNRIYRDFIEDKNGFRFIKESDEYLLMAYLGINEEIDLPTSVEGHNYVLKSILNNHVKTIKVTSGVSSIGDCAFLGCSNLQTIEIGSSIQMLGGLAFVGCEEVSLIINEDNPYMSAENGVIYNKEGTTIISILPHVENLIVPKEVTSLSGIAGNKTIVSVTFEDNSRIININNGAFRNCSNLASIKLPNGITSIGDSAFSGCSNLASIKLPESVTSVGNYAFYNCKNLTSIKIPEGVTSIGSYAFQRCIGLTSIEIPESVTNIGKQAFSSCKNLTNINIPKNVTNIGESIIYDTAYYDNRSNWDNGYLLIDGYLIKMENDYKYLERVFEGYATDALWGNYNLVSLTINGNALNCLSDVTNLETLIIGETPTHKIGEYFNKNCIVPVTFKNVIIKKGCQVTRADLFNNITGINIYVEDIELAVQWDHDYPGWNNGNRVYYGGEWIHAQFKNENGEIITDDYYTTTQLVRQPYVADINLGAKKKVLAGWDYTGDGVVDTIPATSSNNIVAVAIMKEIDNVCTVNFYDYYGNIYHSQNYIYGDLITLPTEPVKVGYTFEGWKSYVAGAVATENISYYSMWTHNGDGHVYQLSTVAPSCDTEGYDKYVCSVCGDEYHDNFVDMLGHAYDDWVIDVEETCITEGIRHRICTVCDKTEEEIVDAHGHWYVLSSTNNATCTSEGEDTFTCEYCDDTIVEIIEKSSHTYEKRTANKAIVEWMNSNLSDGVFGYEGEGGFYYECVDCQHIQRIGENSDSSSVQGACKHENVQKDTLHPVCDEPGISFLRCLECKSVLEAETVDALAEGHTEGEAVEENRVNANCTDKGSYDTVIYCTVCKAELERTQNEIPALGHEHTTVITKPTCTEQGYTTYTCHCGDTYVDDYTNALGHTYGQWTQTQAPTCTEDGEERRDCDACDHFETRTVAKHGHTEVIDAYKAPTCTETGLTEGKHCSVCKEVLVAQEVVNALGHTEGEAVEENRVNANCTDKGSYDTVIYCTVCKAELERTQNEIPALGHEHATVITKPTCTEQGYTTYTCHCGDTYVDDYTNALGHTYGQWTQTQAPTCTEDGEERRDCDACDHFETRTVNATGHKYGKWKTSVSATCTQNGEQYRLCSTCEHRDVKEILAKGHEYEDTWTEDMAPGCTEVGYKSHHCIKCDDKIDITEIPALGHTYGQWTQTQAPTCTEDGEERRDCDACDHFETRTIAKHGHTEGEAVEENRVNANCTDKGSYDTVIYCTVCKTELERTQNEIPALGHEHTTVITKPTCTEQGYTTYTCHCGDTYVDGYTNALGHTYGQWTQTQAPTCTEDGEERRDCDACDHFETRTVAKHGHTEVIDAYKAPTCTETGLTQGKHCSVCKEVLIAQEVVDALGHTEGEAVEENRVNANCTDKGSYDEVVYCSVCDAELSRTEKEIAALGHTYGQWTQTQAPTCTEDGEDRRDCDACDHFETRTVDALGHTYGQWTQTQAPTCTGDGEDRRDCDACDHFETRTVAKHGHTEVVDAYKAPTCTETGLTQGKHCSVCGEVLIAQQEISKTNHVGSEWIVDEEPEVGKEGHKHYECTECGEVLGEETIPALPEPDDDEQDNIAPTFKGCSGTIDGGTFTMIMIAPLCAIIIMKKLRRKRA